MFFHVSKITVEEIVPTIKKMRDGRARERSKAFLELRDRFEPLLKTVIKPVISEARNQEERNQIQAYVEEEFWKILMAPSLDLKDPKRVTAWIASVLKIRINRTGIRIELEKESELIKQVSTHRWQFKNALKRFRQKFNRMPDFGNDIDRINFSNIMKIKEKNLDSIIKVMDPKLIQSLYESIGNKDESNISELIDHIKDETTLPSNVLRDRAIMQTLMQAINSYLTPDQRKVFQLYYLEQQKTNKTKGDLAKEVGMSNSQFKNTLDKAKEKLKESPLLKELYTISEIKRQIRLAMRYYMFIKSGKKYILERKTFEDLISDIIG